MCAPLCARGIHQELIEIGTSAEYAHTRQSRPSDLFSHSSAVITQGASYCVTFACSTTDLSPICVSWDAPRARLRSGDELDDASATLAGSRSIAEGQTSLFPKYTVLGNHRACTKHALIRVNPFMLSIIERAQGSAEAKA
jgi:hypothetical protein